MCAWRVRQNNKRNNYFPHDSTTTAPMRGVIFFFFIISTFSVMLQYYYLSVHSTYRNTPVCNQIGSFQLNWGTEILVSNQLDLI